MLSLPGSGINVWVDPTDMRKIFDSRALLVRGHLGENPMSHGWHVFLGKWPDRLKILYWDRDGYALWHKRLEAETFQFPVVETGVKSLAISATDLA